MAQWTKLWRIEKFVNPIRLFMTSEKSGGLHLAEPGLTAGSLCNKIWARVEILKACRFFTLFNQGTVLFQ